MTHNPETDYPTDTSRQDLTVAALERGHGYQKHPALHAQPIPEWDDDDYTDIAPLTYNVELIAYVYDTLHPVLTRRLNGHAS